MFEHARKFAFGIRNSDGHTAVTTMLEHFEVKGV